MLFMDSPTQRVISLLKRDVLCETYKTKSKKILNEFIEHPVWTKHFGNKKENYVAAPRQAKYQAE